MKAEEHKAGEKKEKDKGIEDSNGDKRKRLDDGRAQRASAPKTTLDDGRAQCAPSLNTTLDDGRAQRAPVLSGGDIRRRLEEIEAEATQTDDIEELGRLYTKYMEEDFRVTGKRRTAEG